MNKCHAVSAQPLQYKALAAKEAAAESAIKRDAELGAQRGAEERILLADEFLAYLCHIDGNNVARVGRGKRNASLVAPFVMKMSHKQRLAGQSALPDVEQLTH